MPVVLDGMDLTDKQWAVLEPIFRPRRRPDGRGRPWTDARGVLNGVLWILRTGAPWADLKTDVENVKAQSLYHRLGFDIVERVER